MMSFWVMILIAGADVVYPVGTLQISSVFDEDSQSLAGGIFHVATRLGTSLGMATTSSIATSVSQRYSKHHPSITSGSPEALMVGFRAAGWTIFAAAALSILIGIVGLRGIGIVGKISKTAEDATTQSGEKDTDESSPPTTMESFVV